ncbi:unnamed protein product [Gongylonema pulchrum]|uniref:GlnD_UR_UTase domain-containing protein n=1 Tax=Gongylonema pulchrum TaxID=637853 RepID=A0A183DZC9_9BILA|nr:unnamed protein product [Gongylonema pulchrum]
MSVCMESRRTEHKFLILQFLTFNELFWLLENDSKLPRQGAKNLEEAACRRAHMAVRWLEEHEADLRLYYPQFDDYVYRQFLINADRLFRTVHFEHISPDARSRYIKVLTNVGFLSGNSIHAEIARITQA